MLARGKMRNTRDPEGVAPGGGQQKTPAKYSGRSVVVGS